MKKVLGFLAAASVAGAASAQITDVTVVQVPNTIDGVVTNDVFISFEGEYTGSQLLATLDSGTFYQVPAGGDAPPTTTFIGFVPELEFDTFFAQGAATDDETVGNLSIGTGGGPVNIDISLADPVIDSTTLQIQYGPAGADFIADQTDFLVARISISEDAFGSFQFLASSNQVISDITALPIENGVIVPEPATAALLGLGGLAMLRRRSA